MLAILLLFFFFFKQKTAYEMRISDWSSDVCSSDLRMLWNGYSGPLGYASAAAMADYIVVNMFAQACAGDMTTKEAAASAAKRAARSSRVCGRVRPPGGLHARRPSGRLPFPPIARTSEARRGGEEWVRPGRTRWA